MGLGIALNSTWLENRFSMRKWASVAGDEGIGQSTKKEFLVILKVKISL